MKYLLLILVLATFVAAGCENQKIKGEVPSSPKESYEVLPR